MSFVPSWFNFFDSFQSLARANGICHNALLGSSRGLRDHPRKDREPVMALRIKARSGESVEQMLRRFKKIEHEAKDFALGHSMSVRIVIQPLAIALAKP